MEAEKQNVQASNLQPLTSNPFPQPVTPASHLITRNAKRNPQPVSMVLQLRYHITVGVLGHFENVSGGLLFQGLLDK